MSRNAFMFRTAAILIILVIGLGAQGQPSSDSQPYCRIIAGGPDSFMEVRHVVLAGSNYEIGKQLAEVAKSQGMRVAPSKDRTVARLRHEYLKDNYPAHFERMRGMAESFGLSIDDDRYDFSGLWQPMLFGYGCSVVFYPGSATSDGHGILCRNYDFTTGTISGFPPDSAHLPMMARPFVLEMHPEEGYASIAICAFDLLGGVLDGMNSEGLTVAVLAEDESTGNHGLERGNEVGVHELLCLRFLLDNCANVQQAKEAMLRLKHYYGFIPCHYIIADRLGKSFVFEFSPQRNQSRIVDGQGPQIVTNHLISNYADISELPEGWSYDRFRIMHEAISNKVRFSIEDMRAINALVRPTSPAPQDFSYAPNRTLWHALYDTRQLSLEVSFYLGESPPAEGEVKPIFRYSDPITFQLAP